MFTISIICNFIIEKAKKTLMTQETNNMADGSITSIRMLEVNINIKWKMKKYKVIVVIHKHHTTNFVVCTGYGLYMY